MKPITPQECFEQKQIHPTIIKVVNGLLKQNYNKGTARLLQKDIVNEFLKVESTYNSNRVFDEKLLEIESFYEQAGWDVIYDSPAYNESYEPSFEFRARKASPLTWKDR